MKQFFVVSFTSSLVVLLLSSKVEASPELRTFHESWSPPGPTVELPLGKLEGEERKSHHGKIVYAFEGVPYAAPPTGHNRFRDPQEVEKWTGTKLANKQTQCIQLSASSAPAPPYKVEGVEDCLFLNIYSSNLTQTANLDVIVFISGDGFVGNEYTVAGPEYLLDENVVYVNVNFRQGHLGFLSTEDEVVPGNMGMRDQIKALEFVRKYIRCFGGNPDSVTLTEGVAGSGSVHFHLLSPLSKGLFHRGVSHGGTMLNPWTMAENSREKAEKLAALVGCSKCSLEESVECMRTKPVEELVAAFGHFQPWMYTPFAPFGVVVDSWAKSPSLPEHPLKLIKHGKVQQLPWIISHTNSEGLFPGAEYYTDEILNEIETKWNTIMPHLLDYNYTVELSQHDEVSQKIRDYYMGHKTVCKQTFMDFIQILTDRLYVRDVVKAVKYHLEHVSECSVQLYFFTYHGVNKNHHLCHEEENFGASHNEDVVYQLSNSTSSHSWNHILKHNEQDFEMVKLMVKMLVSFARDGHADVGLDWPRATKEKLHRLHISGPRHLKIDEEVFTNSTFWEGLPIKENEKLFHFSDY